MKKQLCALLLAFSCTVLCAGGNQNTGIPSKEHFFLVLMVGQSNMAGRGIPEAADKVANFRIVKNGAFRQVSSRNASGTLR